jgi:hypothetical protein
MNSASRAPTTARPVKAIVAVEDLIFLKVIGQVDAPGGCSEGA